jgi:regulator of sigma D
METLPDIPLRRILKEISFEDLINLVRTPGIREVVQQFFSIEANFRDLEKRVVLECIDQLEQVMETNLFFELIDYFESKGYRNLQSLPEFKLINQQFFKEVSIKDPNVFEIISDLDDIRDVEYRLMLEDDIVPSKPIKELIINYQHKLDDIEQNEIERFKKIFFKGPNSYDNIKEYLEQVNEYVEIYLTSRKELVIKSAFYKCITNKLNIIHRLFD